jgi:hypothetical protein
MAEVRQDVLGLVRVDQFQVVYREDVVRLHRTAPAGVHRAHEAPRELRGERLRGLFLGKECPDAVGREVLRLQRREELHIRPARGEELPEREVQAQSLEFPRDDELDPNRHWGGRLCAPKV